MMSSVFADGFNEPVCQKKFTCQISGKLFR